MKIALFSDTHALHKNISVPDADILIFAGDMTNCRTDPDASSFNNFLGKLPHKHKVVIAGNHDHALARDHKKAKLFLSEAVYLQDESVVISGITIYGAPWQPLFNSYACDAFSLLRGKALQKKWRLITPGIDILVTHAPPAGILDQDGPVAHGCSELSAAVEKLKPKYHIFGHIHSQHGMIKYGSTRYINCNVQGKNGTLRSVLLLDYYSGEFLQEGRYLLQMSG